MKSRIFTFLAAVLLTGISAFAQSVEPIKGDVNGDGRVNVADIAGIIDIIAKGEAGYFYLGSVRPTAENYTSLPGVIGSYTSISEASGATATIAAGETLYMMCPASWMEGKSVELEDESGNPISFLEEKDAITISGYVIYRTQALNDEKTVVLKTKWPETYFSYVGTDKSEKLVEASTGNLKSDIAIQIQSMEGVKTYTSIPTELESGITIAAGFDYVYVIAPTSTLNRATTYLVNQSNMNVATETLGTFSIGSTEYTVKCTPSEVGTVLTAWKPTTTYYWYAGQTQPSTMSSNPTVDDTNFTNNKWHTLNGNQIQQFVTGGDVTKTWYVAVPASLNLAAKAYDMSTPDNTWINKGTITVNGVSYKVWNIPTADEIAMVYMK